MRWLVSPKYPKMNTIVKSKNHETIWVMQQRPWTKWGGSLNEIVLRSRPTWIIFEPTANLNTVPRMKRVVTAVKLLSYTWMCNPKLGLSWSRYRVLNVQCGTKQIGIEPNPRQYIREPVARASFCFNNAIVMKQRGWVSSADLLIDKHIQKQKVIGKVIERN